LTILMEWARAAQLDVSSERLARLIATPPPALPRPLRVVRAEVAQETGRPVVRLWTGEVPPLAHRHR
jgi:hypothetical protein